MCAVVIVWGNEQVFIIVYLLVWLLLLLLLFITVHNDVSIYEMTKTFAYVCKCIYFVWCLMLVILPFIYLSVFI